MEETAPEEEEGSKEQETGSVPTREYGSRNSSVLWYESNKSVYLFLLISPQGLWQPELLLA